MLLGGLIFSCGVVYIRFGVVCLCMGFEGSIVLKAHFGTFSFPNVV